MNKIFVNERENPFEMRKKPLTINVSANLDVCESNCVTLLGKFEDVYVDRIAVDGFVSCENGFG